LQVKGLRAENDHRPYILSFALTCFHWHLMCRIFIHSFIPDIYIAPLQETYSEALVSIVSSRKW